MSKLKDYPIGSVVLYKNVSLVVEGQKGNRPLCTTATFHEPSKRRDTTGWPAKSTAWRVRHTQEKTRNT